MGAIAGGIASGRVPAGGKAGDPVDSWINPTSVLGGVLAVAAVAYLAAVYLVWDARRLDDVEMAEYFRRRAIVAAVAVAVIAVVGVFVLRADAAYLFDGLTSRALPLVILSVACGVGALLLLVRDAARGARVLAVVAVAGAVVVLGCRAVALPAAGEPHGRRGRGPVRHADRRARRRSRWPSSSWCPASSCSTSSTRSGLLPEEGVDDVADRQAEDAPDQRAR